jgi:hypothetical protein
MNVLKKIAHRSRDFFVSPLRESAIHYPDAVAQLQLKLLYRSLAEPANVLPGLSEVGFKAYSQTDEDGILLYIFALIGTTSRTSVEICAGNGIECNTANLIINHGWHGLLVDGNETLVKEGSNFYQTNPHTFVYPPAFVHAWITRENVNRIVSDNGFEGEVDLLSLDMDGVDYWIWEALSVIEPRVVVAEYQDIVGPERALTVPYSDNFNAHDYPTTGGVPDFCGASLAAFTKLATRKGYRLVGCNQYGYNAFFIKDPLGRREIPEIPVEECFRHPKVLWGMKERFPAVADLPWVEV